MPKIRIASQRTTAISVEADTRGCRPRLRGFESLIADLGDKMPIWQELLALFVVLLIVFGFFGLVFMIGFGIGRIGERNYDVNE